MALHPAAMGRFVLKNGPLSGHHVDLLLKHIHNESLKDELMAAVEYVVGVSRQPDWMVPLGVGAQISTPQEVINKINGPLGAVGVIFGGVLGMLDLCDRV